MLSTHILVFNVHSIHLEKSSFFPLCCSSSCWRDAVIPRSLSREGGPRLLIRLVSTSLLLLLSAAVSVYTLGTLKEIPELFSRSRQVVLWSRARDGAWAAVRACSLMGGWRTLVTPLPVYIRKGCSASPHGRNNSSSQRQPPKLVEIKKTLSFPFND